MQPDKDDAAEEEVKEAETEEEEPVEAKELLPVPAGLEIADDAVKSLARWYCREAGVRQLAQRLEKISRKLAYEVVQHLEEGEENNGSKAGWKVSEDNLTDYVGKPVFTSDRLYEEHTPPGVVMGLAWTSMGGYVDDSGVAIRDFACKVFSVHRECNNAGNWGEGALALHREIRRGHERKHTHRILRYRCPSQPGQHDICLGQWPGVSCALSLVRATTPS